MKTFILGLSLLSLNTFAYDATCYQYDPSEDRVFYQAACSTIDLDRAEDEGFPVFGEQSTDYLDGCLMAMYEGQELSREYDFSVCEQGLDEGWFVLGSVK